MKHAEYNIENQKVEVYNSITGVESVSINGSIVSKGFSWFGRDHFFKIGENQFMLRFYPSLTHWGGTGLTVYKNGSRVALKNNLAKGDMTKLAFRTIMGITLGVVIGLNIAGIVDYLMALLT